MAFFTFVAKKQTVSVLEESIRNNNKNEETAVSVQSFQPICNLLPLKNMTVSSEQ